MSAQPRPAPSVVDGFLFRLMGYDPSQADVVKWIAFTKSLLTVFVLCVGVLWALLTYNFISSTRRILDESLAAKGRSIARAAARAAFVPLTLRDKASLERVMAFYEDEPDIASLEIEERGGVPHTRRIHPELEARRFIEAEAAIAPTAEYADPAVSARGTLGVVRARLSCRRIDRTLRAVALKNLLGSGALLLAVLALGLRLIRNMTRRLRDLIGEARLAEALRRSNQDLEQFAFVASHDLQAPLRTVSSFVQLLKKRYHGRLDADADQFIDAAAGGAQRMQALIRDLLEYSRIGRTETALEPVDLGAVLDGSLAALQATIQETGAVVIRKPLPQVRANAMRMGQLLQNLIGNALKYRGEASPHVEVGAEKRDGEWVISVQDNGIGIEPEYFEKIFVIFQRLHTRQQYPGTGIGLAVCKKIVEFHGGRIWVESKPGEGSTFRFSIPIKPEEA